MRAYILSSIKSFLGDPPDSEFQRGYLAALVVAIEDNGRATNRDETALIRAANHLLQKSRKR